MVFLERRGDTEKHQQHRTDKIKYRAQKQLINRPKSNIVKTSTRPTGILQDILSVSLLVRKRKQNLIEDGIGLMILLTN